MNTMKLSQEELLEIKNAVSAAEGETAGEIATAFIKESDDYAVYELLFALFCGFLYLMGIMFFESSIEQTIKGMFWDYSIRHLLVFYSFSPFLVIGLFYFLANFPIIDRLVVPKSVMKRKVNQRAVRHFLEAGVYNTKDRTGILIFISQLEHRVELVADKGIAKNIPQEKWDSIVNHIIAGIKTKRLVPHLTEAIAQCGQLLAVHYPVQPDDVNELNDNIAILEN